MLNISIDESGSPYLLKPHKRGGQGLVSCSTGWRSTALAAHSLMRLCCLLLLCLFPFLLHAQQKRNELYERYIDTYRDLAVQQMQIHGIPASITLAQGIFESGAGRSELAIKANNHFGIKKGVGWTGKVYVKADDRPDDQFRVYSSVKQSYEDHSSFLKAKRYSSLFSLDILDYKGWARGLKECGYATNPAYAQRLIDIIELYNLHDIDLEAVGKHKKSKHSKINTPSNDEFVYDSDGRKVLENNGLRCIAAQPGDSWDLLAGELEIKKKKLLKYNEAYEGMPITSGTFIYMQKKAKKGPKTMKKKWHKVSYGESMYFISQLYGVRIHYLYKMNFKTEAYIPQQGDLIKVR